MSTSIAEGTTAQPFEPSQRQKQLIAAADAAAEQASRVAKHAPDELVRRMTQESALAEHTDWQWMHKR